MPQDGSDFAYGDVASHQDINEIKNHYRGATLPSNIQPGMIFSDEDDDKLHHAISGSGVPTDEILQKTKSADVSPIFDNLYLSVHLASVSDPPTQLELEGEFGASPSAGFIALLKNTTSGSNKLYDIRSDGASYFYLEFTKAT